MIVLNRPATAIPVGTLPGLLTVGDLHQGEQDPFQRLFSFWGLFFPDSHHPDRHGRQFVQTWIMTRRQERQVGPGQMQRRGTRFAPMAGWDVERTLVYSWQHGQFRKQVRERSLMHL